jgi:hypothetical protein
VPLFSGRTVPICYRFLLLLAFSVASFAGAQQATEKQSHAEHAMGFSQTTTTHHFYLKKDGGVIQVEANSPDDLAGQDHIRMHLQHIAKSFAAGSFDDPMEVHDEVPPGVPVMKKLKTKISYQYESTQKGGRVTIRTGDSEALAAIHEFLRYQIREHHTGDPLTIS